MAVSIGAGWSIGPGWSAGGSEGGGGGAYATGGTVVDITGYRVHIFNSSGTFATTSSWPSGLTIEYLVVAGGGGSNAGGGDPAINDAGGGGAGGLLTASGVTAASSTNYGVTVGAGGGSGTNGGDSSLIGGAISVTSVGGGAGGLITPTNGNDGGSGGGAGLLYGTPGTTALGGAGIPGQGYDGGDSYSDKDGPGYLNYAGYGGGSGGGAGLGNPPGTTSQIFQFPATGTHTVTAEWLNPNTPGTTYTWTVASGLPISVGQPMYVVPVTGPGVYIKLFCYVVSYSGTTIELVPVGSDSIATNDTYSSWIIDFTFAGGGCEFQTRAAPAGGAGGQAYYPGAIYTSVDAVQNFGGGGYQWSPTTFNGGSGVVLIKYAYP